MAGLPKAVNLAIICLLAAASAGCSSGSDSKKPDNAKPSGTSASGAARLDTAFPSSPKLVVANTDGLGVFLRRAAGGGEAIKAWIEGTIMLVIGEDKNVDGKVWKNVKDPDGNEGWVLSDFLAEATPAPTSNR